MYQLDHCDKMVKLVELTPSLQEKKIVETFENHF